MRFDMFALALKTYFAVCSYSSIRFLRHCKTSHCAFCASFEITSQKNGNPMVRLPLMANVLLPYAGIDQIKSAGRSP